MCLGLCSMKYISHLIMCSKTCKTHLAIFPFSSKIPMLHRLFYHQVSFVEIRQLGFSTVIRHKKIKYLWQDQDHDYTHYGKNEFKKS